MCTYVCVRYAQGWIKGMLCVLGFFAFALGCFIDSNLGGFWVSFYTLISLFFLVCIAIPWVDYLIREHVK